MVQNFSVFTAPFTHALTELVNQVNSQSHGWSWINITSSNWDFSQMGSAQISYRVQLILQNNDDELKYQPGIDAFHGAFKSQVLHLIPTLFKVQEIDIPNFESTGLDVFTPTIFAGDGFYISLIRTDDDIFINITHAQL